MVATMGAKLIDAKMDQLAGTVMITRCTHRVFGPAQWAALQRKLGDWQTNLRAILATMAQAQAQQGR